MKARILCIFNSKGGCSKTTLCLTLSAELARRGKKVMVCDTDEQLSATAWSASAPDSSPYPAAVVNMAPYHEKVHREIEKQLDNYDYILVDTPGALSARAPQAALLVSDLCIVPVMPSPADYWAVQAVKVVVEKAKVINPDLKVAILPTRVGRTVLSRTIVQELETLEMPILKARMGNRVAYQEAAITGRPLYSLGRSANAATEEIRELADEILTILGDSK